VNGIPGRSLPGAAIAALVLTAAPVALAATGETPAVQTRSREARFEIVKAYHDGPWVKPTLELLRSENEWKLKMADWYDNQVVIGTEAPPQVDWKHNAVVVLSLGSCFGHIGVTVNKCLVEGDQTILDLHFEMTDQWDPNGEPSHPAVILAVDRADIKNIELRCDATVDGLPPGLGRKLPRFSSGRVTARGDRVNAGGTEAAIAPAADNVSAPASDNVLLGETKTTWGRVKADYRGALTR